MAAELPRCVVCRIAVEPAQDVVFRPDGCVQHVKCPEVECPVCSRRVEPDDPIRRDGEALLHGNCWMRRARAAEQQGGPRMTVITGGSEPAAPAMSDVAGIRARILLKLDTGGLPNDIPTKVEGGFGDGVACDGCGEQISASQAEHDFTSPDGRVMRLHITCSGVWQAEVLKRHAERSA